MKIPLGSIVRFRVPRKQGETFDTDYPAIVYKGYPGELGLPLGILVIFDGVPSRYGKVIYSKEPKEGCWSPIETDVSVIGKD